MLSLLRGVRFNCFQVSDWSIFLLSLLSLVDRVKRLTLCLLHADARVQNQAAEYLEMGTISQTLEVEIVQEGVYYQNNANNLNKLSLNI